MEKYEYDLCNILKTVVLLHDSMKHWLDQQINSSASYLDSNVLCMHPNVISQILPVVFYWAIYISKLDLPTWPLYKWSYYSYIALLFCILGTLYNYKNTNIAISSYSMRVIKTCIFTNARFRKKFQGNAAWKIALTINSASFTVMKLSLHSLSFHALKLTLSTLSFVSSLNSRVCFLHALMSSSLLLFV